MSYTVCIILINYQTHCPVDLEQKQGQTCSVLTPSIDHPSQEQPPS